MGAACSRDCRNGMKGPADAAACAQVTLEQGAPSDLASHALPEDPPESESSFLTGESDVAAGLGSPLRLIRRTRSRSDGSIPVPGRHEVSGGGTTEADGSFTANNTIEGLQPASSGATATAGKRSLSTSAMGSAGVLRQAAYIVAQHDGGRNKGRVAVSAETDIDLRTRLAVFQGASLSADTAPPRDAPPSTSARSLSASSPRCDYGEGEDY